MARPLLLKGGAQKRMDTEMHGRPTTHKRFQKHAMLRTALGLAVIVALTLLASMVLGQEVVSQEVVEDPGTRISLDLHSGDGGYVSALKIALLLAALTFAPSIILAMTSFTRIIVVLALLRQAVGVVQLPPTRVLVGLALFLTLFTMTPVLEQVDEVAIQPYEAGEIDEMAALKAAIKPLRMFMLKQTREEDLGLFLRVSHAPRPKNAEELSTTVIIPAFMLSELKAAFQMGALLFLPFLVIDMVVASILMSMGMMMLPPMTISLPLKLMVFVLTDGWGLVIKSLAESFVM
jgi:flagellar biosynthetic protein FliP